MDYDFFHKQIHTLIWCQKNRLFLNEMKSHSITGSAFKFKAGFRHFCLFVFVSLLQHLILLTVL